MSGAVVAVATIEPGIASLRVATDDACHLGSEFVPSLERAVRELKDDESVRTVLVEGGDRYFSAGASREGLLGAGDAAGQFSDYVAAVPRLILSIPVPTVACMTGHAVGGGLVLGLWCDMCVLAEESLYGANFMALGFTPGMGATTVVPEIFGAAAARELLFTGRMLTGVELARLSGTLARAVVPRHEVRSHGLELARAVAEAPRDALVLLKENLTQSRRRALDEALIRERANHATLFPRGDVKQHIAERYPQPAAEGTES